MLSMRKIAIYEQGILPLYDDNQDISSMMLTYKVIDYAKYSWYCKIPIHEIDSVKNSIKEEEYIYIDIVDSICKKYPNTIGTYRCLYFTKNFEVDLFTVELKIPKGNYTGYDIKDFLKQFKNYMYTDFNDYYGEYILTIDFKLVKT